MEGLAGIEDALDADSRKDLEEKTEIDQESKDSNDKKGDEEHVVLLISYQ